MIGKSYLSAESSLVTKYDEVASLTATGNMFFDAHRVEPPGGVGSCCLFPPLANFGRESPLIQPKSPLRLPHGDDGKRKVLDRPLTLPKVAVVDSAWKLVSVGSTDSHERGSIGKCGARSRRKRAARPPICEPRTPKSMRTKDAAAISVTGWYEGGSRRGVEHIGDELCDDGRHASKAC